jgi:hypothetical protein
MHFQHLFVSLLALGPALAIPQPDIDEQGLAFSARTLDEAADFDPRSLVDAVEPETRDVQDDATDLFARATPKCPSGLVYSTKYRKCVCKQSGYSYNTKTKKCVLNCGSQATAKSGKCVCKKSGYSFNSKDKKCTLNCGSQATNKSGKCVCKQSGYTFNSKDKKCTLNCGSQATNKSGKCVCKQSGYTFNSKDKKCSLKCPSGATAKNGKCVCSDSNKELKNGSCQCKSGKVSDGKGGCRASCPSGTEYKDSACRCTNSELELKSGKCQCKISGASLNGSGKCVCPKDKTVSGGQCVDKCPSFAPYKEAKDECVCEDVGKVFNPQGSTEDKICACPSGLEFKKTNKYPNGACQKDCLLDILVFDIEVGACVCLNGGVLQDIVGLPTPICL